MTTAQETLTQALAVRKMDKDVLNQFVAAARGRGITQAEYLKRLVKLHDLCMKAPSGMAAEDMLTAADLTAVTL